MLEMLTEAKVLCWTQNLCGIYDFRMKWSCWFLMENTLSKDFSCTINYMDYMLTFFVKHERHVLQAICRIVCSGFTQFIKPPPTRPNNQLHCEMNGVSIMYVRSNVKTSFHWCCGCLITPCFQWLAEFYRNFDTCFLFNIYMTTDYALLKKGIQSNSQTKA